MGPCDESESEKAMHTPMTEQRAASELWKDARTAIRCINHHVRHELSQNQFDALVSFAYNVGQRYFEKSTLFRYINITDKLNPAIIRKLFLEWDKSRVGKKDGSIKYITKDELESRREAESMIFTSNIYRMHK